MYAISLMGGGEEKEDLRGLEILEKLDQDDDENVRKEAARAIKN